MRYILSDFEVLDIVDKAVEFGVKTVNDKNALALTYAAAWIEGYIAGNSIISEDDQQSLRATINKYYFF